MISKERCCGLSSCGLEQALGESEGILGDKEALDAYYALRADALREGLVLKICSGFRSFERQLRIIDLKMSGKRAVLDDNEHPLDISSLSEMQKITEILRFSALPGFSRHHFGTDFDIYAENLLPKGQELQLTCHEYDEGMYFYSLGSFLESKLNKYGFFRPFLGKGTVAREPWHISYYPHAERYLASFDFNFAKQSLLNSKVSWAESALAVISNKFETLFSQEMKWTILILKIM